MVERHKYRGHQIVIELFEVMPRLFRWKWTIDGAHTAKSRVLLAEAVARSEAFLYAQVMVARLKAPAPGPDQTGRFDSRIATGRTFGPLAQLR